MEAPKYLAYAESDRRAGCIAEARPRVRGGLKFAQRGPISGEFLPFSTDFRQNDAHSYFRSRFSVQIRIPCGRLYRKRHTYRYRIWANFWDTRGQSPIMGRFLRFFAKMTAPCADLENVNSALIFRGMWAREAHENGTNRENPLRHFANGPDIEANISGTERARPSKFSLSVKNLASVYKR